MEIPKIIHQTWKNSEIPQEWRAFAATWKNHHPEWEYILWTDQMARDFVIEHYGDYLEMYDAFEFNIERADVIRYLVLHKMGGVYADLDMECLKPVEELLTGEKCVLAGEPPEHFDYFEYLPKEVDRVANNAFMASVPGHDFWLRVMERLEHQEINVDQMSERTILNRTGPAMLEQVVSLYFEDGGTQLSVLDSQVTCPLRKNDDRFKGAFDLSPKVKELLKHEGTYAIHYWGTTWWPLQGNELLINPEPNKLPGFSFYQGLRSVDFDLIDRQGRDMKEVARACYERPEVVAFDTDGNLMSRIDTPLTWQAKIGAGEGEGLYLRKGLKVKWVVYKAGLPLYLANRIGYMHWPSWIRKIIRSFFATNQTQRENH